jgi:hypothetical protein
MIAIQANLAKKTTFETTQNDAAILHQLNMTNDGDADLEGLTLTLTAFPPLLEAKTWPIDRLASGGELHIPNREIREDKDRLFELSERMLFDVTLTLTQGEETLTAETVEITALARHEWGGGHHMPEMLAAFVMPNDPAVSRV